MTVRWRNTRDCSHINSEVCKFCDFDRYYANTYPNECPWGDDEMRT